MVDKFAPRWTERIKGAAMVGALAVAAASGYAFAISPTIDGGRDFVSGVTLLPAVTGSAQAYVVPAGHQYTITDVTIANPSSGSAADVSIYVSNTSGACSPLNARTNTLIVPVVNTLHLPFNTGISIAAGKTLCLFSNSVTTYWTIRGYLSNAT